MDPCLVLYTVSTSHNQSILFVNREVVRVVRESTCREGVSVEEKDVELVENKELKILCPDNQGLIRLSLPSTVTVNQ